MNSTPQTRRLQHRPPVRGNVHPARVERTSGGSSLFEVLDRVLDKGIVLDPWVRVSGVSVAGIDLITVEARVVVASFETNLRYFSKTGHV